MLFALLIYAGKTQKRDSMSVEQWKSLFDIGTVVLAGLVFLLGAGALITGNIINKRQSEQLTQFARDLRDKDVKIAEAQRDAADANAKTAGLRLDIAKAEKEAAQLHLRIS
jgi:hypothetical protein